MARSVVDAAQVAGKPPRLAVGGRGRRRSSPSPCSRRARSGTAASTCTRAAASSGPGNWPAVPSGWPSTSSPRTCGSAASWPSTTASRSTRCGTAPAACTSRAAREKLAVTLPAGHRHRADRAGGDPVRPAGRPAASTRSTRRAPRARSPRGDPRVTPAVPGLPGGGVGLLAADRDLPDHARGRDQGRRLPAGPLGGAVADGGVRPRRARSRSPG